MDKGCTKCLTIMITVLYCFIFSVSRIWNSVKNTLQLLLCLQDENRLVIFSITNFIRQKNFRLSMFLLLGLHTMKKGNFKSFKDRKAVSV